jgi:hypothetical protein
VELQGHPGDLIFGHKYGLRANNPFVVEYVGKGVLRISASFAGIGVSEMDETLRVHAYYSYRLPERREICVRAQKGGCRRKVITGC